MVYRFGKSVTPLTLAQMMFQPAPGEGLTLTAPGPVAGHPHFRHRLAHNRDQCESLRLGCWRKMGVPRPAPPGAIIIQKPLLQEQAETTIFRSSTALRAGNERKIVVAVRIQWGRINGFARSRLAQGECVAGASERRDAFSGRNPKTTAYPAMHCPES